MRTGPSVREVTCDRGGALGFSTFLHRSTRVVFYKGLDVSASILFAYRCRGAIPPQKGENSTRPFAFNSPRPRQAIFRTYRRSLAFNSPRPRPAIFRAYRTARVLV